MTSYRKPNHMIMAHFNPKELEMMDMMQGGRHYLDSTDIPHYMHLEEKFKQPNIQKLIMKEYEHHAKGGQIGEVLRKADEMRKRGRNGDSEVAFIGPNTKTLFDKLMHGGSINPSSGKPEYFNLGGFFNNVGKTIRGGLQKAGSALGGFANSAVNGIKNSIPSMMQGAVEGGAEGGLGGALGGALLDGGESMLSGSGGHSQHYAPQQTSYPSLGQLGQQFLGSSLGKSVMQKGQGLFNQANNLYSQAVQNPYTQGAFGAYNGYQAAQNPSYQPYMPSSNLNDVADQAMKSPYGQSLYNQGQNLYNQANQTYQNTTQSPYGQAALAGYNAYQNANQNPYGQNSYQNPYGNALQNPMLQNYEYEQ